MLQQESAPKRFINVLMRRRNPVDGTLLMLWAGFSQGGYTQGVAVSDNGEIDGRFSQCRPLFEKDGGHGMLFKDLQGQWFLTLHSPNEHLQERPRFFPVREENGQLIRL